MKAELRCRGKRSGVRTVYLMMGIMAASCVIKTTRVNELSDIQKHRGCCLCCCNNDFGCMPLVDYSCVATIGTHGIFLKIIPRLLQSSNLGMIHIVRYI